MTPGESFHLSLSLSVSASPSLTAQRGSSSSTCLPGLLNKMNGRCKVHTPAKTRRRQRDGSAEQAVEGQVQKRSPKGLRRSQPRARPCESRRASPKPALSKAARALTRRIPRGEARRGPRDLRSAPGRAFPPCCEFPKWSVRPCWIGYYRAVLPSGVFAGHGRLFELRSAFENSLRKNGVK